MRREPHPPAGARRSHRCRRRTADLRPNLDGKIEASELQATLGASRSLTSSRPGRDPQGRPRRQDDGAGRPSLDYSPDYATNQRRPHRDSALEGKWYEDSFPKGRVTAIDARGDIEGVYAADDHAFTLLGIASREESPKAGKTLVVYDSPIVYHFPLEPGAT